MRKILIFTIGLLLTLGLSGQIRSGVINSSNGVPAGNPELVVNGTFNANIGSWTSSGAYWNWQTDGSGGGWCRHTASVGSGVLIYQGGILTIGQTYTVVFTIGGRTAGVVVPQAGGTSGTTRSVNGTYTQDILCSSAPNLRFDTGDTFDGYIDNVSCKLK